ncbi:MAG: hypothetical protein J5878_05830 [Oscillospiraceae bacterium]|nr:hypothetical protein [Oscillospiraceae bacterium]
MSQNEASREALEFQALKEQTAQTEKQEYVERPRAQRILALMLAVLVMLGVLLYFAWISGILK